MPLFSSAPTSSLTPKLDRVRVVAPFAGVMTFTGPLKFLDTQSSFDHIFGLSPIMLQIIPRSKRQYAAEDTEYLASKFLAFCNLYCLHIFYNSLQPKYVSNTSYNLKKMLTDISLALYNLKMVYNHRGRTISLTPDDLFSRHTDFLPLLSSNALTW